MLEKNAAVRADAPAAAGAVRSGVRRRDRLRRPGQLRDQRLRRRPVRLPAALGDRLGQPHGDARAEPVGEAGPGDRREPAAELPASSTARPVVLGLWVQAEIVAMATDLAEVVGGAIALNLLFGLPLLTGGLVTGAVAFLLLAAADARRPALHRGRHGALRRHPGGVPAARAAGADRPGGRGRGPGAPLRRRGEPRAGHRHPGRHRDAARDLPALRAGARAPSEATHGPRSGAGR